MDQVKIGSFISKKRKELGLTQKELAEMIQVTDKSISKWERGNGLPDVSRLKPLCDALKISMNELVAGEEIGEDGFSQKVEENIMSLIKENEKQKKNGTYLYVVGVALIVVTMCLLGVSIPGSEVYDVRFYIDFPSFLFEVLFIMIGILLSGKRDKASIVDMVTKLAIPVGAFISLFSIVLLLANINELSSIGPILAVAILSILYGIAIYMVAIVVKSHIDEKRTI